MEGEGRKEAQALPNDNCQEGKEKCRNRRQGRGGYLFIYWKYLYPAPLPQYEIQI